jgi:hypothetical protein
MRFTTIAYAKIMSSIGSLIAGIQPPRIPQPSNNITAAFKLPLPSFIAVFVIAASGCTRPVVRAKKIDEALHSLDEVVGPGIEYAWRGPPPRSGSRRILIGHRDDGRL